MYEKIKVSIPKVALEMLKKDCEEYKIWKEDGSPNFNAFINILIVNYYEHFSAVEEELHDELKKALSGVPEFYRGKAYSEIVKVIEKRKSDNAEYALSTTFSFKPNKSSERAVTFIEHALTAEESLSSYYRRLFLSYLEKTRSEREKIIHSENYGTLLKAIKKGVKACVVLQCGDVLDLSVYDVATSKDELFNYVLGYGGKNNKTIRLANVKSVTLLSESANIPETSVELFKRQIVCGAQYPMYSTDREPIKVRLTPQGETLFKKIYLYRPTPVAVDGDVYTFDCSANQLLYYFERFGENAVIISPKKLGIFMRNYYHFALKKYKEIYR